MRFTFLVLPLLLAGFQDPAHPLDKGTEEITAKLLSEYLTYLASDELEGRCAGFPGNDKATAFIAERFLAAGLKPVGDPDEKGDKTFWQSFKIRRGELTTRNCVGLLEGSDPKLKDEIVVIGAHHDHVGRLGQQRAGQLGQPTKDDEVWNGADDNGSGTTALLGVVKAFGLTLAKPKRSILFMTFSAEEWGLLGSRHYADHPIFPLVKTVTMFNMDMVGRTDEEFTAGAYALGTVEGDVYRPILEAAAKRHGLKVNIDANFGDGSDHISFFNKGIPILGLSEKGPCPDYHKVTDHSDRIAYPTMERIARTAALTLYDIANLAATPKRDLKYSRPKPVDSGTPRLGAYLESVEGDALKALNLPDGRGAMSVTGFPDGSVAQAHGVKESDVLVAFNGTEFDAVQPRETLTAGLAKVVRGDSYPLDLIRDGKPMTIRITWAMTEVEIKLKALLAEWIKTKDPVVEGKIIDMGDVAEPHVAKLDPEIAKPLLAAFAMRKKLDSAVKTWGVRTYRYQDKHGESVGSLKLGVQSGEGVIQLTAESNLWKEISTTTIICARDGRLSVRSVEVKTAAGTKSFTLSGDQTHPTVLIFLAGMLPPRYEGTRFNSGTGQAEGRLTLEPLGEAQELKDGQPVTFQKVAYRETGREAATIWVDAAGVVVRMTSPSGTMVLE